MLVEGGIDSFKQEFRLLNMGVESPAFLLKDSWPFVECVCVCGLFFRMVRIHCGAVLLGKIL